MINKVPKILNNRALGKWLLNSANIIIGMICTVICASTIVSEGLELLFLLPLSYTISHFIFNKTYSYWKDNIGMSIIFISIVVRYLATPVLMTISNTRVPTVNPTVNSMRVVNLIAVFELFILLFIINLLWTKHRRNKETIYGQKEQESNFKLSILGFIFIFALIFLVIYRNRLYSVFSHYSTWWYISRDNSDLYYYDLMAIEVFKSVIIVTIISWLSKRYHACKDSFVKNLFFILALIIGMVNTMFYQYTQRTALTQLILSTMVMMFAYFPKKKRILLTIFGIGGVIFIALTFATGTLQYKYGSGIDENTIQKMAIMSELYTSGPSIMAITRDNYDWVRANMSLETYISDIIKTTHIFGLFPFFRSLHNIVAGIPTTNELFVISLGGLTYILPNYVLCTYYVSFVFGWILEAISIIIVIKLICKIDNIKKKLNDACYYYALTYSEILLGQAIFVNNIFLLWHAFTNLPFWLLMFSYVNRYGNKIRLK